MAKKCDRKELKRLGKLIAENEIEIENLTYDNNNRGLKDFERENLNSFKYRSNKYRKMIKNCGEDPEEWIERGYEEIKEEEAEEENEDDDGDFFD